MAIVPPTSVGGSGSASLDFASTTSDTTVSGTEAAPTDVLSLAARTFDGATAIVIEYFVAVVSVGTVEIGINLWDMAGPTDLGRVAYFSPTGNWPCCVRVPLTPSAGSHTYRIRAWRSSGTNGTLLASAPRYLSWMRSSTV